MGALPPICADSSADAYADALRGLINRSGGEPAPLWSPSLAAVQASIRSLCRDIAEGIICIRNPEIFRDSIASVFEQMLHGESPENEMEARRRYCGVSVYRPGYHREEFVQILDRQLRIALDDAELTFPIHHHRVIVIPAGMCPPEILDGSPTIGDADGPLTAAQRASWSDLKPWLQELREPVGSMELTVEVVSAETIAAQHIAHSGLDFGIYGKSAVGVYEHHNEQDVRFYLLDPESERARHYRSVWRSLLAIPRGRQPVDRLFKYFADLTINHDPV